MLVIFLGKTVLGITPHLIRDCSLPCPKSLHCVPVQSLYPSGLHVSAVSGGNYISHALAVVRSLGDSLLDISDMQ